MGRGKRRMLWALGIVVGLGIAGALALQVAIASNGPAVLDTVDRLTGGARSERQGPFSYGEHAQQRLFIHAVAGDATDQARPVLVFMHGGSWRDGDPDYYNFIGRSFAPEGFLVVNLGYRLGDEGRWPAMMEDSAAGLRWVRNNIADHGGDPEHLVVMGHSAGAYNVAMLALDPQWLAKEGMAPTDISGVVGLAGPFDFYPFDSDSTKAAFGQAPDPEATQPVNFVSGDAPPMLLLHGLADTTVKPRNSRALKARFDEAGATAELHEYEGMDHSQVLMAMASPWRGRNDVHQRAVEFMRRAVSSVPVQAETR